MLKHFKNWDQWLLTKANTHQTLVTTSESKNPLVSVLSKTSKNWWFSSLKNWLFYRQQLFDFFQKIENNDYIYQSWVFLIS